MIEFYGVTKIYPGGHVGLRDLDVAIARGELVFLTGPSGAGKTTFLRLIYRDLLPTSGVILVNGRNVTSVPRGKIPYLRRTIGVVRFGAWRMHRKTIRPNDPQLLD